MYKDKDEIENVLKPIFKKYNVRYAVLFGSYAKGSQNEKSDIDILIDSGLKGLEFYGLLEDVSNAVNVPVDLIDTQEIIPNGLLDQEVKKTGVTIYG